MAKWARRIVFAVPIAKIRTTGVVRRDQPCVPGIAELKGRKCTPEDN
jgi:hypothetical protein